MPRIPNPFRWGGCVTSKVDSSPPRGGLKADFEDDVLLQITDQAVRIGGFMTCTPRNGIAEGEYPRVR